MFSLRWVTLALLPLTAYAGPIYSTGFENPPFTVGGLASQDGWTIFNPSSSFDIVETTQVKSGSQAVEIGPTGTLQSGAYHSDSPAGPLIDLSADIYLFSSSTQSEWQFAGLGPGLFPYIGGIDVFSDNSIHLITAGLPNVGTFTKNAWHNVDFLFNMTTQTYSFSLDGSLVASGVAFCGSNGSCTGGLVSSYGNSFFDVFSTLNSNDLGAMDNFALTSGVPEPASLLLSAAGLVVIMIKRYTSRKA